MTQSENLYSPSDIYGRRQLAMRGIYSAMGQRSMSETDYGPGGSKASDRIYVPDLGRGDTRIGLAFLPYRRIDSLLVEDTTDPVLPTGVNVAALRLEGICEAPICPKPEIYDPQIGLSSGRSYNGHQKLKKNSLYEQGGLARSPDNA